MEMDVAIYALIDPRNGFIRYVGSSINPTSRFSGHLNEGLKSAEYCRRGNWIGRMSRWLADLYIAEFDPIMEVLEVVPSSMRNETEQWWIDELRDETNLLNRNPARNWANRK